MDINVSTGLTLPNGDVTGVTYFVGSTNATGTAPSATTYFYYLNPGSFAVTGTVVVAAQSVFSDTPAHLAFASDRPTELDFEYSVMNQAQPILAPNSSYTCSIFDGSTLIGTATSTVNGSTSGGLTNANVSCTGVYPNNAYGASGFGHAFVNLPATYNVGDVYTWIVSH
jgi:hypothetical protein